MLLPEAGRAVRSCSKSENSSGSVSNPPTAVGSGCALSFPRGPGDTTPPTLEARPPRATPQYLRCHWRWAWYGTPPRGLRRPGPGPRDRSLGVRRLGPRLREEEGR